ncbi:MAG TPA: hypothetical protein VLH60_04735 [Sedimentisphaerales bacterium]|nr:hypothetical protein [Sedimentisphaerales bacterium]
MKMQQVRLEAEISGVAAGEMCAATDVIELGIRENSVKRMEILVNKKYALKCLTDRLKLVQRNLYFEDSRH